MADENRITSDEPKELNYQEDVKNVSLEDIFEEQAEIEDGLKNPPTPPIETPPVETKTEEPAAPVVEEKKEEPLDTEKLTDSIADKLVSKLAPDDASKEEKKDLRTQLKDLQEKATAEGRELTYDEALEFLAGQTKEMVKNELKDEVKQEVLKDLADEVEKEELEAKTAAEKQQAEKEAVEKAWGTQWDGELADLSTTGKIPAVNANETRLDANGRPLDPGKAARYDIFVLMNDLAADRRGKGLAPIMSVKEIYYEHYLPKLQHQDGGKTAPVNGARNSVGSTSGNEFTYGDIHNTDIEDILRGA